MSSSGHYAIGWWKRSDIHGYAKRIKKDIVEEGLFESGDWWLYAPLKKKRMISLYDPYTDFIAQPI